MKYQHDTLGLLRHLQGPLFLSLEFVYLRIICLRLLLSSPLFSSEALLKGNFHLQIKLSATCLSHDLETNLNLVDLLFPQGIYVE